MKIFQALTIKNDYSGILEKANSVKNISIITRSEWDDSDTRAEFIENNPDKIAILILNSKENEIMEVKDFSIPTYLIRKEDRKNVKNWINSKKSTRFKITTKPDELYEPIRKIPLTNFTAPTCTWGGQQCKNVALDEPCIDG